MATLSPGIYVNEYDNTTYTNASTTTGTTVCIIGYARKGPIGVPTEIYSYNSFIKTFGYPIAGTFSGLAVRNVLSAGGGVLYVRIADNTAAPSRVIAKNAVPFKYGYTYFEKKSNITKGTYGYNNDSNYVVDVQKTNGSKKTLYLRSPEGLWTTTNILKQIGEQLNATQGWQEMLIPNPKNIAYGLYSYNFVNNNARISEQPYYMVISKGATTTVETLANRINASLKSGSNATFELNVYGSVAAVVNGVDGLTNSGTKDTPVKLDDLAFILDEERTVALGYYEGNGNGAEASNKKTIGSSIILNFNAGEYTYRAVIDAISKALEDKKLGVYCYFKEGDETDPISKLVFVSTNTEAGFNFCFKTNKPTADQPVIWDDVYTLGDLFFMADTTEFPDTYDRFYYDVVGIEKDTAGIEGKYTRDDIIGIVVSEQPRPITVGPATDRIYATVNGNSLIINTTEVGAGNKVSFQNTGVDGDYLFENLEVLPEVEGTDYLNISVAKDGFIYFYDSTDINPPTISYPYEILSTDNDEIKNEKTEKAKHFYNLTTLLGGATSVDGNVKVSAINRDMVMFTSKENGTGTNNLSVQVKTSISPLYKETVYTDKIDSLKENILMKQEALNVEIAKPVANQAVIDELKAAIENLQEEITATEKQQVEDLTSYTSHDIIVYQDNTQVEYFENVSYNIYSSNNFEKIMNETTENGGSNLVTVEIIKNDYTTDIIQIKDGVYKLGVANSDTDIPFDSTTMNVDDYDLYDYALGNDGIVEDSSDLFLGQLDKETAAIMNKDLYDFHVLITPDCNEVMEVQDAALACCEERGDAIYIMDTPLGLDKNAAIDWHNGRGYGRSNAVDNTYGAVYWPWGKVYDSYTKTYVWAMPSTFMAAQYCKVDKAIGPYQAPAGDLYGAVSIVDIEASTTRKDRDDLYTGSNRINPFLKYGDGSIVAYGEKTMQRKNSTLTKVHVRRMMIQIKKDLRTALNSYIFMPSTSSNLSEINSHLNTIMQKYKTAGGISSFSVVCDSTNNTSETLQQDIINASIHCIPVGTIEQINIDCALDKSAESVSVS